MPPRQPRASPTSSTRHTSTRSYLASRTLFGVKLGLQTIRALAEALDHPETSCPTILIGGTNGKGSVAAYLDAALHACGLRVGRYTSPHLVRVHERITVGGSPIRPRALARAVGRVRDVAEALVRTGRIPAHPTYFEVLTAAALWHFRREAVDVALMEVGLGGRLDATGVCNPLVSAIVTVERDHEQYLGTTLAEIAREKAGVLRPGRTTVLGDLSPEARRAVQEQADSVGAHLVDASRGSEIRITPEGLRLRTPRHEHCLGDAFPAAHQRHNALVAVRVLEEALDAGVRFDLHRAVAGLASARWPGRLEWVPGEPPLLLDGAHNPAAAAALADYLRPLGSFVLLFGIMADKNVEEVTRLLFPLARRIVLTRTRAGRAAPTIEIVKRSGDLATSARRQAQPRKALALARSLARPGEPVVVAGSLYLVGEVKRILGGGDD